MTVKLALRVLLGIALLHIVVGLALPLLMLSESFSNWALLTLFPDTNIDTLRAGHADYLVAVFGPTVASWGVLMWASAKQYFRAPSRSSWLALLVAVLIWFLGDTLISYTFEIGFALTLNTIAVLSLLLPIVLIRPAKLQSDY